MAALSTVDCRTVGISEGSGDGSGATAEQSGRRTQLALCVRQGGRGAARRDRGDDMRAPRRRLGDEADGDWEAAPRESESDVGVEATAEQLQVVAEYQHHARHDERHEHGSARRHHRDTDHGRTTERRDRHYPERGVRDPRT